MRGSIPRRSPRPARVDAGSQVEPRMVSRSLSDHPPALGACQRRSHRIDRGMAREFARFGRSARACRRSPPSGFGSGPPMPGCHAWQRPGRRIRRVATGPRRRRETAARTRRIRRPATFTAYPEETVRAVASRTPAARRAFCRHSIRPPSSWPCAAYARHAGEPSNRVMIDAIQDEVRGSACVPRGPPLPARNLAGPLATMPRLA